MEYLTISLTGEGCGRNWAGEVMGGRGILHGNIRVLMSPIPGRATLDYMVVCGLEMTSLPLEDMAPC